MRDQYNQPASDTQEEEILDSRLRSHLWFVAAGERDKALALVDNIPACIAALHRNPRFAELTSTDLDLILADVRNWMTDRLFALLHGRIDADRAANVVLQILEDCA